MLNRRRPLLALGLCLALCAAVLVTGSAPADAAPGPYVIDKVHSTILFKVKHMGVSWTYGRFNDFSGSFQVDDADLAKSSVEVDISADSVDTANEDRDKHLRNEDFLHVEKYPSIGFKSTKVEKAGENTYRVTGDFSLHGVTKSVTLRMEKIGEGKGREGGSLMGFEGQVVIKRSEYGIPYGIPMVGDEIHITLAVEGFRK
jgi:polyisoprenoid-binding protein YceI